MASFLRSNFGFEFGAKVCLFWSLWQVIPDWLVLEATGCEQRELSLLCCGSTSTIPAAKLWNKFLATGLLHDGVSMNWHIAAFQASRRCNGTVPTWYRKKRCMIFDYGMMTHEESLTRFAGWRMELYADIHLGCSSICRRVGGHIHWEIFFFGAAAFLLGLDSLCLFRRKPFLVSISGRPLLLFH